MSRRPCTFTVGHRARLNAIELRIAQLEARVSAAEGAGAPPARIRPFAGRKLGDKTDRAKAALEAAAAVTQFPVTALCGPTRAHDLTRARQLAAMLLHAYGVTIPQIALVLERDSGHVNRSFLSAGRDRLRSETAFRADYDRARALVDQRLSNPEERAA